MNSLCLDELNNLVLKYESTSVAADYDVENWLDIGDYKYDEQNDVWEFGSTKDIVKFVSIAKQTIEHFEKVKLELDVCEKLRNVMDSFASQDDYEEAIKKARIVKHDCPICNRRWDVHKPDELKSCQKQYQATISSGPKFEFKRDLMPYQKMPVNHLLAIGNAANFEKRSDLMNSRNWD